MAVGAVLAASLGAVETLSQRRRQVEAMSAEQRDDLFRNEQQFRALPPEEQQRIRDLHDQIESAPDREMLRATMNRYCKWFETQPPFRRAKLLDKKKTLEERIATVKEFLANKVRSRTSTWTTGVAGPWPPGWTITPRSTASRAWARGPMRETRSSQPSGSKSPSFRPTGKKRSCVKSSCGVGRSGGPDGQMPIAEQEMARLRAGLSPDLRAKLEAKKPADQARIIADWLRETASHELNEQLVDFFEKTISDEERDRLMSLPGDEMYESLSKQYRSHVLKQSKSGEPPRGIDQPPQQRASSWPRTARSSGVARRPRGWPVGRHRPENSSTKSIEFGVFGKLRSASENKS